MTSKRRGAGEGSIFQRKDGRWVAEVSVGWDRDGRERKTVYGRTRQDVVQRLDVERRRQRAGEVHIDERSTVAQFLESWLPSVAPRVRPRTASGYEQRVRSHLIPQLGRLKLAKLNPSDVVAMIATLQRSGLSTRTATHCRAVLRCALSDAMRWGLVSRNVAKLADAPHVAPPSPVVLTPTEATAVLHALTDPSLRRLATVAMHTGLRQGELLGLTWENIDLEQHKAHVRHALQRVAGRYELVETKSASSRRVVPLTAAAVDALLEERQSQREAQLRAQHWTTPIPGLCFTTTTGTPRNGTAITHAFDDAIRVAGLRHLRWHDLRAAHGALLLAAGVDISVVSRMLGHSAVAVTARHYAGVGEALGRQASDRFAALLAPSI